MQINTIEYTLTPVSLLQELEVIMRSLGQNPSPMLLQTLMRDADSDKSGELDFPEFLNLMIEQMSEKPTDADLREAFRVFDKDQSGFLTIDELRFMMSELGEKFSVLEVDEMLKEADLNNDGKINYDELVKMLMS